MYLDDDVGVLLLGVDEGVEIVFAGCDGGLDGLQGVPPLLHVSLDLPGKLDLVRDVEVDLDVHQISDSLVVERVETLSHKYL